MDYEKKYKEALEKARQLCAYPTTKPFTSDLQDFFPELRELEDERIRKELIAMVKLSCTNGDDVDKKIAWLEKQGEQKPTIIIPKFRVGDEIKTTNEEPLTITKIDEKGYWSEDLFICGFDEECIWDLVGQKPADKAEPSFDEAQGTPIVKQEEHKPTNKVEPKFHEGEWLCENEPNNYARFVQILEIVNIQGKERYRISRDIHNDEDIVECRFVEDYWHPFNIQDAKDGDVLQLGKVTAIFKEFIDNKYCKCYCSVYNGGFEIPSQEDDDNCYGCGNATPATKEQREQLEKAMAEDGYEWDSEMKELKKIVQKNTGFNIGDEITVNGQVCKVVAVDNLDWSEDDEAVLDALIQRLEGEYIHVSPHLAVKCLKSLKYRVQPQPKQEWSEEDEVKINRIVACLENLNVADNDILLKDVDWLKSLSPHKTWKPSDEQMKALKDACDEHWEPDGLDPLYTLYQDLKKLKG